MRTLLTLILLTSPALAQFQRLSFGVTGGVPLNEHGFRPPLLLNESRRYTVGPSFEFRFTDHIAAQFNPLYKRLGYGFTLPDPVTGANVNSLLLARSRQHAWELPILGKYYFGNVENSWRLFAAGGVSLSTGTERGNSSVSFPAPDTGDAVVTSFESSDRIRTHAGPVAAVGLLWRKGRFGLAPEFRYTYWGSRHGLRPINQMDFLLTLRF
jgi:hypothetical protein